MLKIYHVSGTRSVRPIWLCYELDLAFEIEPIDFSSAYRASPEWRAISPAGKVPAMADDDVTMFESGAMVDYILERYGEGRLRPAPGTVESALHHQWCWFAEATLVRPLGLNRVLKAEVDPDIQLIEEAKQKASTSLQVVEQTVVASEYLLGTEFGAADIMMGYSLNLLANVKFLDGQFPHAQAYLERLKTRDACQRAMNA